LQENRPRSPNFRQIQSLEFLQFLLPVNRFGIFHGRLLTQILCESGVINTDLAILEFLTSFKLLSIHWEHFRAVACVVAAFFTLLMTSVKAQSQTVPPPAVVKLPAGLNLGGTSFYDGFGSTDPGWIFMDYARWNHLTSVKDNNGDNSPLFASPRAEALSNVFHVVYISPISVPNGALAFEALLPIVGFDSHFNPSGLELHDNGWNFGDLTFGVDYQSKPISFGGTSVFSWRTGLDFAAPTGGFDASRDLNQSSGFWSITPYLAATVLLVPKWEISTRFSYDYNFSTTRGANPPIIPGFTFHAGQAGQAWWINFASSYEVFDGIRPGINGYWLQQLTDDRTNGFSVPLTRVEELYLGPGLSWQINQRNVLNLNIYIPVSVRNTLAGPQFNIQHIHQF